MAARACAVDLARGACGRRHPQHHVGLRGAFDQGVERLCPCQTRAVDQQGGRQAFVRELVGGEARGRRHGIDCRFDGVGERVDQARLAGAGLARDENAYRLGVARLGCRHVAARGRRDMGAELRGGDAQVAAVKIDRRAADLLDEGARQAAGQMLAARVVDLPREALAQLLGRGRHGIEQPHDAPQIVALLDQAQRAAPAVQPHQLRHGDAVAQREARRHEIAQVRCWRVRSRPAPRAR